MYSAVDSTFDGVSSVVLSDDSLGQEAVVIPGIGANCVSYKVTHGGDRIDVLYPPPDAATLRERPSGFGIPILFPWPNRIEDSRFTFDGREVQLPVSDSFLDAQGVSRARTQPTGQIPSREMPTSALVQRPLCG